MNEKNKEFFPISTSKTVEVRIMIDVDPESSDRLILINAAEALKYRAENGHHKIWTRKLEIV